MKNIKNFPDDCYGCDKIIRTHIEFGHYSEICKINKMKREVNYNNPDKNYEHKNYQLNLCPEEKTKCMFNVAWGTCREEPVKDSLYCRKHSKEKCWVCGKQAIRECPDAGVVVCGIPLCEECKCPRGGH